MPAFVVIGLGYGDEGKGTTVDFLVREYSAKLVVRFNGGAQAGHNVVTPDGRHHTFSQWGAGTLAGASTYLSRHVLVNPVNFVPEAEHLASIGVPDPWSMMTIDEGCRIVTPWHVVANQAYELARGAARHGSCGHGIGETVKDAMLGHELLVRDLYDRNLRRKLLDISNRKMDELLGAVGWDAIRHFRTGDEQAFSFQAVERFLGICRELLKRVNIGSGLRLRDEPVVFEGAQGVLLDEYYGFAPHTTWSDCTFRNALGLLNDYERPVIRIGATRTYMTRHGDGPLVTEDAELTDRLKDPFNPENPWQGSIRCGFPDFPALRYALRCVGGVDGLALTHLDQWVPGRYCWTYDRMIPPAPDCDDMRAAVPSYMEETSGDAAALFEDALEAPVLVRSFGPTYAEKESLLTQKV